MKLAKYKACICEGSAESAIIDILVDNNLLIFTREEMLDWAAEGEAEFVWSPHPSLIPFVESGQALLSPPELEEWRVRWDLLPNTSTLLEPTYARQLAACDVVVTDGLSMLIEGQVLEKPVVFIERSDHLPFNEAGNLTVQGVHRVNSVLEAKSVVEDLLCYGYPLAGRQREIVRGLLGDPGASGRVLQEIAAEAVKEGWRAAS